MRRRPDVRAHSLGFAHARLERYTDAIKAFRKVIRLCPDDVDAHRILGATYLELGRHAEAVKALKEVVRLCPDDGNAYFYLGDAYAQMARYAEALERSRRRPD